MSTRDSHELSVLRHDETLPQSVEDNLPPQDYGRGAYLALACSTIAQAPIWGMFYHEDSAKYLG